MITIDNNKVAYFDVDNTLVVWTKGHTDPTVFFKGASFFKATESEVPGLKRGFCEWGLIHTNHIDIMRFLKFSGFSIVVWSQSGAEHAANIIKQLGLENIVDLVISKPILYYDDVPIEKQGIKHRYIGIIPKSNY